MQAVLRNASPSLISQLNQGLRQTGVFPSAAYGLEGNFSTGPQIVQAVSELLSNNSVIRDGAQSPSGGSLLSTGLLSYCPGLAYSLLGHHQILEACAVFSRSGGVGKSYDMRLSAEDIMQCVIMPAGSAEQAAIC